MKNVKRFCIIMLLVIPAAAFLGLNAYAATSKYVKLASGTLWEGDEVYRGVTYKKATDEATIVSIKSSKPKVIEATKDEEYKDLWANTIVPLKLGKSTITVTYKYRGKKYSTSALYTVKKYPAPFKSMKVNGKNVDLKENKFSYNVDNFTKSKAKIQFSLKSGWKLTRGYTYGSDAELIPFKNGQKLNVKKGQDWTCVFFDVTNKKNETMQYSLRFKRK